MFTGIIEVFGEILDLSREKDNLHIKVRSSITSELKIDQSVAHNGACLTVVEKEGDAYVVTAIDETLKKTNLGSLEVGQKVNLERCTQVGSRLDGHIVQGHVDTVGTCIDIVEMNGSKEFFFNYKSNDHVTVSKGSITINGVSLTVVHSDATGFSVCIIPYTLEHTGFNWLQVGDQVNLEFDVIGKYIAAYLQKQGIIQQG